MISFSFKKWFIFNENKKPYDIALEIVKKYGGDEETLKKFSDLLPTDLKDRNRILALIVFYGLNKDNNIAKNVSKADDQNFMNNLKKDMMDYLSLVSTNSLPVLFVDDSHNVQIQGVNITSDIDYNSYMEWTEIVHGKIAEKNAKEKFVNLQQSDLGGMKIVAQNPEGTIKVYDAHGVDKCVMLGRGQKFCISKPPGQNMWQSYRDRNQSTFYFVYDQTRNDRLKIVVVDARIDKQFALTDVPNSTGTIGDPEISDRTISGQAGVNKYFNYLNKSNVTGINGETDMKKIFLHIGPSEEEEKEKELLSNSLDSLEGFKNLGYDYMHKYIGRGHILTDEQFKLIYDNYFSLLQLYVSTGVKLPSKQVKVLEESKGKYKDLIKNYLHSRLINDEDTNNFDMQEYEILKSKNMLEAEKEILNNKPLSFWIRNDVEKSKTIFEDNQNFREVALSDNNENNDAFSTFLAIYDVAFIKKHANKFYLTVDPTRSRYSDRTIYEGLDIVEQLGELDHQQEGNKFNLYGFIITNFFQRLFYLIISNFKTDNFKLILDILPYKQNSIKTKYNYMFIRDEDFYEKKIDFYKQVDIDYLKKYTFVSDHIGVPELIGVLQKNNSELSNYVFNKIIDNSSNLQTLYQTITEENSELITKTIAKEKYFADFLVKCFENAKQNVSGYKLNNLINFIVVLYGDEYDHEKNLLEIEKLEKEFNELSVSKVENWVYKKLAHIAEKNLHYTFETIDSDHSAIQQKLGYEMVDNMLDGVDKTNGFMIVNSKFRSHRYLLSRISGNKLEFIDYIANNKNCQKINKNYFYSSNSCLEILGFMTSGFINFILNNQNIKMEESEIKNVFKKIISIKSNLYDEAIGYISILSNTINAKYLPMIYKLINSDNSKIMFFKQLYRMILKLQDNSELLLVYNKIIDSKKDEKFMQNYKNIYQDFLRQEILHSFSSFHLQDEKIILNNVVNNIIKYFPNMITLEMFSKIMTNFFVQLDFRSKQKFKIFKKFKDFYTSNYPEFNNAYLNLFENPSITQAIKNADFDIKSF